MPTPYLDFVNALKKDDLIYICNQYGSKIPAVFIEFKNGKCICISGSDHFKAWKTPFKFNMAKVRIEPRTVQL